MSKHNERFEDETFKSKKEKVTPLKSTPLICTKGTDIKNAKIEWLLDQMIPLGEVSMIAGDPGIGKSTLLMHLTAIITTGKNFKAGTFNLPVTQGNVVILSLEDRADTVLKPRIVAAGGDPEFFHIMQGDNEKDIFGIEYEDFIRFDRDLGRVHQALQKIKNIRLIIIDPVTAYVGDIDDNKNTEVRRLIAKLTALARLHNCAILLNTHLSKSVGKSASATHRVMGSIAYTAASRAVYLVTRHDVSPQKKRKVVPFKNNYGDDQNGFAYEIEAVKIDGDIPITRIKLLDEKVVDTAADLLGDDEMKLAKTERERARIFLFNLLKAGSKPHKEIKELAEKYDFSIDTIKRARTDLFITISRSETNKKETIWFLSPQSPDEI
jgi:energy-coupling factor transporter ATP-binding protein EcfA2